MENDKNAEKKNKTTQKRAKKKKHGISLELSEARNNLKNENPNETKRKTNFAARRGCKINEGATGRVLGQARVRERAGLGIAPGLKDSELYGSAPCCALLCWMSATGRART